MKQSFILCRADVRERAKAAIDAAGDGYVCTLSEPRRNSAQNALLWASLHDISEQVDWYGMKLTPDEWKAIFTAALKKTKVVPAIDGGFVVVGQQTSAMTKRDFSELLELIFAFAAERGVKLSEMAA